MACVGRPSVTIQRPRAGTALYNALYAVKGQESTCLPEIKKRIPSLRQGNFRGCTKIKIQSVASSAGGTAITAMVAQPYRGHLNGNVNNEFDMEECYARATVAGTRAQSLTVIFFAHRAIG